MTELVFTHRDGNVFHRGCFMRPEDADRTLTQLRGSGPWATVIADELERAIKEANHAHA